MNQKNSRFVRRLIISYSGILMIILLMGVYLYSVSIDNVSREIRTQTKLSLNKSVSDLDTAFKTMDVLAGQMVSNSNILHLTNMPDNSSNAFYLRAYYAKEDLSSYAFTESLLPIKASFIHIQNTDYLLSFSQFADTELHFISEGTYDRATYDSWMTMLHDRTNSRSFVSTTPYKRLGGATYLYKLPLDEYTLKKFPATLCFEVTYSDLTDLFSELNLYDTGYIYVTDSEGKPEFSLLGEGVEEISADLLKDLVFTDGLASVRFGNKELFITRAVSPVNGWQYYLVQPADKALYSLTQYRNFYIGIVLSAILVAALLVLYLSRSNVRKIRQLGTELADTLEQQENLKQIVETQKPVIRQSYLRKIMRGNISTELELDYAREYLNINASNRKFAILYLTVYVNQLEIHDGKAAVTAPEDTNYTTIIGEALARYFPEAYIYRPQENDYALLINTAGNETTEISNTHIKTAFMDFHEEMTKTYALWCLAGLGNWNKGLMLTWKSYQQAREAISYSTKRNVFKPYSTIERDTSSFYYPAELTNQLTNFITSGNSSQVLELFEILRHENMEERSLPIQMMTFLLSDIRNTLYKVRFSVKDSEDNSETLQTLDTMFTQHTSLKLCEDLAVRLSQVFEAAPGTNQIIHLIQSYIDDHFTDPSLCLTKISDEFSISESYFSFRFKEEIGENFSSYLERTRLNHAHELLVESELNISDICNEVGYNNAHTFRRAFKKIYGISPKEARIKGKQV